jgi:hypothetical protein
LPWLLTGSTLSPITAWTANFFPTQNCEKWAFSFSRSPAACFVPAQKCAN